MATPGRLIAHLESTPGFSLRHLRFLIVDETDRLLRQAYQGWLPKVMAALHGGSGSSGASSPSREQQGSEEPQQGSEQQQQDAQQPARRVVKFVVSATLTRDPSKIDRLQLTCPRYIAMSAGGQQPAGWAGGGLAVPAAFELAVAGTGEGACAQEAPVCPALHRHLSPSMSHTPSLPHLQLPTGTSCRPFYRPVPTIATQQGNAPHPSLPFSQWTTATSCRAACRKLSWWCPLSASLPRWPRCYRWVTRRGAMHAVLVY